MTIPDMLKNAPMFKRIDPKYKVGLGPAVPSSAAAVCACYCILTLGAVGKEIADGCGRPGPCCGSQSKCKEGVLEEGSWSITKATKTERYHET